MQNKSLIRIFVVFISFQLLSLPFVSCNSDIEDVFSIYVTDTIPVVEYLDVDFWRFFNIDSSNVSIEELVPEGSGMPQGFDVFGDYLFGMTAGMFYLRSSDLFHGRFIGNSYSGLGVYARHANCQNFTSKYYSAEDKLPLLLVSGSEKKFDVDLLGYSYLVRIEGSGSWFNASLIQTIRTVPGKYTDTDGNEYSFNKYGNIMVDRETGHIYVINAPKNIYEMELPPLFDENGNVLSEVELTADKVIRRIDFTYRNNFAQGACIHNGVAYICSGIQGTKGYLQIVDLKSGKELQCVYLPDIGYEHEPEDIAFWRGSMVLSGGETLGVYRVHW